MHSQFNSVPLVIGHFGNSSLPSPLEFQTKHKASGSAVTGITARKKERAARKPPSVAVAEITYRTWTADNLLRHTVYVGLREDKRAEEVRREVARA